MTTPATLYAISPLDGRYSEKLASLRPLCSEYGLIKFRLLVEIRWLIALSEQGNIKELPPLNDKAKKILADLVTHFTEADAIKIKEIEGKINHDVKAVEYYIKERLATHPELTNISEFIHFGCTSEDINNLAYGLMLQSSRKEVLLPALNELTSALKKMTHEHANIAMLARTHGQPASPTTLGKEIANVLARLTYQEQQFAAAPIFGKLNGASGNYNALCISVPEIDWQALSKRFVSDLGLTWNSYTTQIEPHDGMAEYFAILTRINTILIDFNRDIWGYIAIQYFKQKSLANEVGSSTMPHKINPIDFENAEGNLSIANALLSHMAGKLPISRWQRDLSDSTVLRNIGVALGHNLLAYQATSKGLKKLEPNHSVIAADLDQHWEVLGEAIQTVMRRYGMTEPYEKLKTYTRGKPITKAMLHEFINELALPEHAKKSLLALTPSTYIGYASDLAKKI